MERRRIVKHLCIACLGIGLIIPALIIVNGPGNVVTHGQGPDPDRYVPVMAGLWEFYVPYCQSGSIYNGTWSFAGIDIQFGRLTFNQAKAADVAWNWIIGRGVQGLLAFVSYRVFTDALMRAAEISYLPYSIFTSLALLSTRTETLWDLLRGVFKIPGWRIKLLMAWVLISTGYLACFPSLMDLMTGYDASNITQLTLPNNATVDITYDVFVELVIYDSNRFFYAETREENNTSTDCPLIYHWWDNTLNTSWHQQDHICNLDSSVSQTNIRRTLKDFYMALPGSYECTIEQNIYHWGFSAEWLQIFVCVSSVWLFGLWIVYVDADYNSKLCKIGRRMGIYRAILDISEAIREDLGPNLCAYSEAELAAALKKLGPLKYYVSDAEEGQVAHIGLSSRKSEKVELSWDQSYGRKRQSIV